jgi:zinc transporter, ZIP family
MGEAFFWGLVGGSSLLLGAALGLVLPHRKQLIGLMLAFGAGTLVSALTFELTRDAYRLGGADAVTIGLGAGALAYFLGDRALDRRSSGGGRGMRGMRAGIPATALLLGAILDGIPESAVIGLGLLEDPAVSVPVLAAVFISNLPEGFVSAIGMKAQPGTTRGHIIGVWSLVVLLCAASSALGYALLDGASGNWVGGVQAFAAGAVLTMLVETMFPEALKEGGKVVSLVTVLGFALAFLLSTLE